MDITKITSWKDYVAAVKKMRNFQKMCFGMKPETVLQTAKAWEAAVDEATGRKVAERDL
ncbi:hypothetical protein FACS1894190_15990 [Spirochaetia bacterium]|nr:hypothetical protein FACS1894190_15990 [Spirochaetia bacterium]